uniref:Uncharacterized protein n=1 Tax=Oryza barthii TaxID=65489 RepID=A0A0D3FVU8_9ORYZ
MPPVNAGTAAPDSGTGSIAANDGDGDLHGEQSKLVAISDEAPNVDRALATSRPATADGAGGGDDRRLRWAAADAEARREEDAELEKMRVENGVARAENARLWRRLLRRRRERELGVGGVRSNKCRDGAAAMEGEEKSVP